MSRLTRRVALKSKAAAGKTYAQFQAHINSLPVTRSVAYGGSSYGLSGPVGTVGNYAVTPNTFGRGVMGGTSWFDGSLVGAFSDAQSNVAPTIVHGLPSAEEAVNQEVNGFLVYVTVEIIATTSRVGLTRNGFTSTSTGFAADRKITRIIYWDGSKAMQINPSAGTGPTPYDWVI